MINHHHAHTSNQSENLDNTSMCSNSISNKVNNNTAHSVNGTLLQSDTRPIKDQMNVEIHIGNYMCLKTYYKTYFMKEYCLKGSQLHMFFFSQNPEHCENGSNGAAPSRG